MATANATYHKPEATLTLEYKPVRIDPGELLALSEDLAALVSEGLIREFADEHNVVRYRPSGDSNL